mgnify:CR=1 FL=1
METVISRLSPNLSTGHRRDFPCVQRKRSKLSLTLFVTIAMQKTQYLSYHEFILFTMSRFLRDSAERHFQKASQLLQKKKHKEALKELEKADEAAKKAKADDLLLKILSLKGQLMLTLEELDKAIKVYEYALGINTDLFTKYSDNDFFRSSLEANLKNIGNLGNTFGNFGNFSQAKNCYELCISSSQKLLEKDPKNVTYQVYLGNTQNNLGTLLFNENDMDGAKIRYEKALEIREKVLEKNPRNVTYQADVGIALNSLGNVLSNIGCIEQAKVRYEKALEIREGLLVKDPENIEYQFNVAMTLNNLGTLLSDMGRIEEAKRKYEMALEIYKKLAKKDSKNTAYQLRVGNILNNLGNSLKDMGRYGEAKIRYEKTLEIYEKLLEKDPQNIDYQSYIGTTLNNFGSLLRNMGRTKEAKRKYEKALEIREKLIRRVPKNIQYQVDVGVILNNLGNLLADMGSTEEAKKRYDTALEVREKLLKIDTENTVYQLYLATTLDNLGILLYELGRAEEARTSYERALEIGEKLLKKNPENVTYQLYVGSTLNNFGNLLKDRGLIEEAKRKYEKTLEIYENLFGTDSDNVMYQSAVAMILNNFGNLLFHVGRIGEAKIRYEKALEMRENLLEKDPQNVVYQSNVGTTLSNLGALLSDMGLMEEAEIKYEKALEIREKLLGNDPKNVVYKSYVGITLNNLGILLSHMGRIKEGKEKYEKSLKVREKVLENDPENVVYQSNVGATLNNIGNLLQQEENYSTALKFQLRALDYTLKSDDWNMLFKIYASMGRCYEKLSNNNQAFDSYNKSIECIESIRGQYSLEELKLEILWNKSHVYTEMISFLCTKMNNSEKAWEYLGRLKSRTLLDSLRLLELEAPESIPEELLTQEEKLLESIRIFDRLIRKTEKTEELDQLTRKIKEKEAELKELYDRIREFSPEYVDLRKGQPLGIKEIKELIGIQAKKTAFVEYYTTNEKVFIFVIRSDEKVPRVKIVDLTLKSLSIHIQEYFNEIVTMKGRTEETWIELSEYLIDPVLEYINDCELVYLVPHGLLHYLPLHALFAGNKRLIEHFPIVYVPSLTTLKYSQSKTARKFESCLSIGYTPNENEKEIFEGEAKLVAELFNVEPKLGAEATSSILKNANNDVIHISCHGGFDWENSLNSGLRLADKDLKMKEIFDLNLSTNLLVLSACETGLNGQKPGDELIGLTRAFLYAGAGSLIVSLWSVGAASTFEFMERFYRKIKEEKMTKDEALQMTQVEFIHDERYSNIYFWAPFILIGDWK